jgi:uncharacterized repeat protein (TIGR02543 family)
MLQLEKKEDYMKKISKYVIMVLVIILIIIGIIFGYCKTHSKVTVYINDIDKIKIYKVSNGKTLENLDTPSMDGYAFMGWYYLDSDEEFNTDDIINKDIIIYAKWAKINIEES